MGVKKSTHSASLRAIDAPHYNYTEALYWSFFNPKLYVDVGKRWRGYGIKYLFFLMLILCIPFTLRLSMNLDAYIKQYIQPLEQIPVFYVQQGIVHFDKPMPYFVKNYLGQVIAIIDTTGTINTLNNNYPYAIRLITKDKIIDRDPPVERLFFQAGSSVNSEQPLIFKSFNKDTNQVFDMESWSKNATVKFFTLAMKILTYPVIASLFLGIYSGIFFILGFMGQVIATTLLRYSITYKQSVRFLSVCATPYFVVYFACLLSELKIAHLGSYLFIIVFMYFCFGILALKREGKQLVQY